MKSLDLSACESVYILTQNILFYNVQMTILKMITFLYTLFLMQSEIHRLKTYPLVYEYFILIWFEQIKCFIGRQSQYLCNTTSSILIFFWNVYIYIKRICILFFNRVYIRWSRCPSYGYESNKQTNSLIENK